VVAGALLGQLYAPFTFENLPKTIDLLARGDEATLAALIGAGGGDGNAWLMRLAVWCNEEYPFEDKSKIRAQRSDYPEFAGVDEGNVPIGVCEAAGLGDPAPPAAENAPVTIDTPALIFSGAFDPATPPAWQRDMASHMAHGYLVTFPAGGHGSGFYYPCAWTLLVQFLHDPDIAPSNACLSELPAPNFARAAGE
jgi:pimeloyl-ACP methyl ester carboxylesterase